MPNASLYDPSEGLVLLVRHIFKTMLELRDAILLIPLLILPGEENSQTERNDGESREADEDAGETLVISGRVFTKIHSVSK